MLTNILLALIVFLLAVLIYVFLRKQQGDAQGLELTLLRAWSDLQLDEKVGRIERYAKDIHDDYKALDQMLRVPKERSDFSETALECILDDQLPAHLFGIRRQVLNGKIPDAYIQSPVGLICIDSKFPLDNYRKMLSANGSQDSERLKKHFIANVKEHLKKIATDYVCPEAGSAEFAFAYVHSEGVYWFLITEASDMLRNFAKEGVQVVSPLTLSHKVELIKANMFAKRLTEEADQIRKEIAGIATGFSNVDKEWRVLQNHFKNFTGSMQRVDTAYQKLSEAFNKVRGVSEQ